MEQLPQLITDEPITVPAIAEKVYDRYWLRLLTITAPTPGEPARVYAEFRPSRNVDGIVEVKSPEVDGDIEVLTVDNLFGLEDPNCEPMITPETRQFAMQAMGMVLQTMKMVAKDKGIFKEGDTI